jgi:hypothetical protein
LMGQLVEHCGFYFALSELFLNLADI